MFGMAALSAFLMGWVLHVTRTVTPIWLDSTSLTLAGLALLTLHLLGIGAAWPTRR